MLILRSSTFISVEAANFKFQSGAIPFHAPTSRNPGEGCIGSLVRACGLQVREVHLGRLEEFGWEFPEWIGKTLVHWAPARKLKLECSYGDLNPIFDTLHQLEELSFFGFQYTRADQTALFRPLSNHKFAERLRKLDLGRLRWHCVQDWSVLFSERISLTPSSHLDRITLSRQ